MSLITMADINEAVEPQDPWSGSRRYLYTLDYGPRPDVPMAPTRPVPEEAPGVSPRQQPRSPVYSTRRGSSFFMSAGVPARLKGRPRMSGLGTLGADDWYTTINDMGDTYYKLKPILDFIADYPITAVIVGSTMIGTVLGAFGYLGARARSEGWF